jgi:NAD(P)-dependent dehydrogenase (short-subunit alcohol dehydrogenase family)
MTRIHAPTQTAVVNDPDENGEFAGKRIVLSGASSGLGRAISIELARRGAQLILIGRNAERLEETARVLTGGGHQTLAMDLNRHEDILTSLKNATNGKRLYGLCHSAGIVDLLPLSANKPERIKAVFAINYVAGMELARAVCRFDVMEETGGSILFVASISATIGEPGKIAYAGSKGALVASARAMAIELARRKIRVNVISPGLVRTEMVERSSQVLTKDQVKAIEDAHPLGLGDPQDVAYAACFMLSPTSKWITGTDLIIDGGRTAH